VRTEGTRDRTPWFEIRRVPSSLSHPRVAIVVPRFGESAVARNRVKRRLRELVRRELLPGIAPQDVVVRATPLAYRVPFETLRRGMLTLASQLSVPA